MSHQPPKVRVRKSNDGQAWSLWCRVCSEGERFTTERAAEDAMATHKDSPAHRQALIASQAMRAGIRQSGVLEALGTSPDEAWRS